MISTLHFLPAICPRHDERFFNTSEETLGEGTVCNVLASGGTIWCVHILIGSPTISDDSVLSRLSLTPRGPGEPLGTGGRGTGDG